MPEHKRQSLMDNDLGGKPASGAKRGGSGGSMSSQDRMKLIAAVVVIIAACLGLAAYYGVFSSSPKNLPTVVQTEPLTAEEKQEIDKMQKENEERIEEMIESGEAEKASAG